MLPTIPRTRARIVSSAAGACRTRRRSSELISRSGIPRSSTGRQLGGNEEAIRQLGNCSVITLLPDCLLLPPIAQLPPHHLPAPPGAQFHQTPQLLDRFGVVVYLEAQHHVIVEPDASSLLHDQHRRRL